MNKHNFEIANRYAAAFAQVRTGANGAPDTKDIREARSALWASDFARDSAKIHEETLARVGMRVGRSYPRVGAAVPTSGPGFGASAGAAQVGCLPRGSGYAMGPAAQACIDEVPCHAHLLGFNTIGTAGFPLAGGAANQVLNVQPANTVRYKPSYLFWEARDNAANLGAVLGLMVNATIIGQPQYASAGAALGGAIPSSAFSVDTPLDVRTWQSFSSINNNQLQMTFANPGGGAVQAHFFGVFWGDNEA